MSKFTDGNSLLKNLGLSSDSESGEDPFQVPVRPKFAGVSEEFSAQKEVHPELLQPRGTWRKGSNYKEVSIPKSRIGNDEFFTTTKICQDFQQSLMKFEQNARTSSYDKTSIYMESENTKERIRILKNQIRHFSKRLENEQALRSISDTLNADNFDFEGAVKICLILAQDPTIIQQDDNKMQRFSKHKSDYDPKTIGFKVIGQYIIKLLQDLDTPHQSEWNQAKEWVRSLGQALNKPELWESFLDEKVFKYLYSIIQQTRSITAFVKSMYKCGVFSVQNCILFFSSTARPYLTKHLSVMSPENTRYWVDLAATIGIPDHFSNIVRDHASFVLKNWKPGDNTASVLISHWPNVLGSSMDFFYKTISPKLIPYLEDGKVEVLEPWTTLFPEQLTASLVADHYIKHQGLRIIKIASSKEAAKEYLVIKSKIPKAVINNQKVLESLVSILDNLKMRNHITSGIKLSEVKQFTAEDLLKNIAISNAKSFRKIDPFSRPYEIGITVVVVKDKAFHILNTDNNTFEPIFVADFKSIFVINKSEFLFLLFVSF